MLQAGDFNEKYENDFCFILIRRFISSIKFLQTETCAVKNIYTMNGTSERMITHQ